MLPGKVKGIGGAMDLVANPSQTKVVITMVSSYLGQALAPVVMLTDMESGTH
jgi:acyl CoA:acetate/3-ketoacid CoA transferase beta subunit